MLFEQEIYDFPFWGIVLVTPIIIGIIVGLSRGIFWRQRLHHIDRQLNQLIKGQKLTTNEEHFKETIFIQDTILQVQEKFNQQTELSQRQATERIEEREKGLQEVVVQERNRLARELHDSVSQQLFAASMMMSAINEKNLPKDEMERKQLAIVEKMIHQSQLEMRALLLHLRPVALKGRTLQEGIEELLFELIEKVPMEVTRKIEHFPIIKGIEDQLFRILQESVSNTLRHAKATKLHVMLIERDQNIILRVVDNGVGFDVEKVRTGSYGLQNMKERAYEVGGTFKLISLPNQGAHLEVKVPQFRNEDEPND
jgi:NarL family two-component system sensor histidine kinase LiaS